MPVTNCGCQRLARSQTANNQTFLCIHVFEERLEVKGLSHGELILNEACLPARYANITLLSVCINSIENR